MKKIYILAFFLTIVLFILIGLIANTAFSIYCKKPETVSVSTNTTNTIKHKVSTNTTKSSTKKEEDHIYGYDENAMQVEQYYDGFEAIGYLEIEKTGVSMPILKQQTVAGMKYSCCLLYNTGDFNLSGNSYIVGHNYENGTLFSNNKNLAIDDKIVVTGLYKNRIEYIIYNIFNTTSTDTSYLTKKVDSNDIELTIQTCNNDKEDTRLIIEAVHHKIKE